MTKAALVDLLRMHLKLPADGVAPPLPHVGYVCRTTCLLIWRQSINQSINQSIAEPMAQDVRESGSGMVPSDASDDDVL